ncbi:MAG: tetratricopeptide repeat protein [Burkholderiales bacterium]
MSDSAAQAKTWFLEGVGHFEAERLPDAERCFAAALALMPQRPSVLTNLGVTRVRLGKPAEALPLLQQALIFEPNNLEAWFFLGQAQFMLGQPALALPCFDKAVLIDDSRPLIWLEQAQTLARLGRHEQAIASFDRALALDATLITAWSHKGSLLRELHRLPEAATCFEKALALGADPQVHGFFLASVRGDAAPSTAPREYVEFLFDDYADEFDQHLTQMLNYQAYRVLVEQLAKLGSRRFESALDLGCGTGLSAPLLKPLVAQLDGLDLSGGMLAKARALGLYRELVHADVVDYLSTTSRQDDLVFAADVFNYIGELAPVFEGVTRVLTPGGIFCFTVELAAPGTVQTQLLPSLRYAHAESHVRALASRYGLSVLQALTLPLREDQRQPVMGLYVYLGKPRHAAD